MGKKYKVGYLIGRFQPFHKGHLHLIKRSFHYVDKLIIGIGSANIVNENNPLTLDVRWKMLDEVMRREKLQIKIVKIVPIDDYLEDDDLWLKKALEKVGKFDVLIGNDDWTDSIFEKAGYKVLKLGFYKRYLYEGIKIRELMKQGKPWEKRVPEYLARYLA
ncbi:adenylyltransferase/cytidyltransferase family protein [Candidatus Roizmanbacteria bacterium]|nr:adenylyltransferase/cytidyltransferase family protein [Candidatus Roizmanbacteria bacterium]